MSGRRFKVDLSHFYNDHRTLSWIFINQRKPLVEDLMHAVQNTFSIEQEFHCRLHDVFLAPNVSVDIIQDNETVVVCPNNRESGVKRKQKAKVIDCDNIESPITDIKEKKKKKYYYETDKADGETKIKKQRITVLDNVLVQKKEEKKQKVKQKVFLPETHLSKNTNVVKSVRLRINYGSANNYVANNQSTSPNTVNIDAHSMDEDSAFEAGDDMNSTQNKEQIDLYQNDCNMTPAGPSSNNKSLNESDNINVAKSSSEDNTSSNKSNESSSISAHSNTSLNKINIQNDQNTTSEVSNVNVDPNTETNTNSNDGNESYDSNVSVDINKSNEDNMNMEPNAQFPEILNSTENRDRERKENIVPYNSSPKESATYSKNVATKKSNNINKKALSGIGYLLQELKNTSDSAEMSSTEPIPTTRDSNCFRPMRRSGGAAKPGRCQSDEKNNESANLNISQAPLPISPSDFEGLNEMDTGLKRKRRRRNRRQKPFLNSTSLPTPPTSIPVTPVPDQMTVGNGLNSFAVHRLLTSSPSPSDFYPEKGDIFVCYMITLLNGDTQTMSNFMLCQIREVYETHIFSLDFKVLDESENICNLEWKPTETINQKILHNIPFESLRDIRVLCKRHEIL